jgi:hypothetical protein
MQDCAIFHGAYARSVETMFNTTVEKRLMTSVFSFELSSPGLAKNKPWGGR